MNGTDKRDPRVLGSKERLTGKPQVSEWKPMTLQEVEALPPLPAPPPRPPLRALPEETKAETAPSPAPAPSAPESAAQPKVRPQRPEGLEDGSVQAMVWDNPDNAALMLRTIWSGPRHRPGRLTESESSGEARRKAALVVLGLGDEVAAEMLRYLTDLELEEITQAVVTMERSSAQAREAALAEFGQQLEAGAWASEGGRGYAVRMLERVVGPHKSRDIIERVTAAMSPGLRVLKNVAPEQVAPFISHEHPQTIALILSQLEPAQAAGILAQFPERMQPDVSYRIATMENVPPAVLKELEEALEASLRDVLGGNQDVGGPKVVADMLNLTGSSVEKNVLDQMDAQDAKVSEEIKNRMFTWADVGKFTDRELQTFLKEADQKDLVIALKATDEKMKETLLRSMTEEVRQSIAQELEHLGPMRLSEVEEVQLRLVQVVRRLEGEGKVTIVRGDADDSFI
ncbi:flagellar motor switch protein FliG [Candidatus Latescibacterota bacterium]